MVDRSATEVESMRSQLANVRKEIQVKAKKYVLSQTSLVVLLHGWSAELSPCA